MQYAKQSVKHAKDHICWHSVSIIICFKVFRMNIYDSFPNEYFIAIFQLILFIKQKIFSKTALDMEQFLQYCFQSTFCLRKQGTVLLKPNPCFVIRKFKNPISSFILLPIDECPHPGAARFTGILYCADRAVLQTSQKILPFGTRQFKCPAVCDIFFRNGQGYILFADILDLFVGEITVKCPLGITEDLIVRIILHEKGKASHIFLESRNGEIIGIIRIFFLQCYGISDIQAEFVAVSTGSDDFTCFPSLLKLYIRALRFQSVDADRLIRFHTGCRIQR